MSIKKQHFQHISNYKRNKTFVRNHVYRKKRCEKFLLNLSNEFVSKYHRTSLEFKQKFETKKLLLLTRLIKNVNFYVETYKICDNRFRDEFNFQIRFVLKQNEFDRLNKNIYNKFTFDKIIVFIILFEIMNSNYVLKRNIIIQKQSDNLRFVFY